MNVFECKRNPFSFLELLKPKGRWVFGILVAFKELLKASERDFAQVNDSHCKVNLHGNGLETSVSRDLGYLDSKNPTSRPERGAV